MSVNHRSADLFGRRNIESPNVQVTVQPTDKPKFLFWYYLFLQNKNDTPGFPYSGDADFFFTQVQFNFSPARIPCRSGCPTGNTCTQSGCVISTFKTAGIRERAEAAGCQAS